MIEIRTDWINDIEYAWSDFSTVIAIYMVALCIVPAVYIYYKQDVMEW